MTFTVFCSGMQFLRLLDAGTDEEVKNKEHVPQYEILVAPSGLLGGRW